MADAIDLDSDGSDIEVETSSAADPFEELTRDNDFNEMNHKHDPLLDGFFASDDEENDEFIGFDAGWSDENFTHQNPRPFSSVPGSSTQQPVESQAVHYFKQLWGNNLWLHIVQETNRYAREERIRNPPPPNSKWSPVDIPTIKAFVGLTLMMGIMRLPSIKACWRQKRTLLQMNFNTVMSRDRFFSHLEVFSSG